MASDAMCAGSTPVRRTSAERARAVHVAARKLAHFVRKSYSAFAYGSVIDSVTVKQYSACAPGSRGRSFYSHTLSGTVSLLSLTAVSSGVTDKP